MSKTEPKSAEVLAVYFAVVKAFKGRGCVTALVRGGSGECRLYGATNLVKIGLLDAKHFGRHLDADTLATLLGCKVVVRGAAACREHLASANAKGVSAGDIVEDAVSRVKRSGSGDLKNF